MSVLLEVGAAKVHGGTAGGAAVLNYITAGGAVGVNYGAAGRQQGVSLAAGGSSKILVSCGQSSRSQFCWRWEQQKFIIVLQAEQQFSIILL